MTRLTELSLKLDDLIQFGKPKTFSPAEKVLRDIQNRVRNEARLKNLAKQAREQRFRNTQSVSCPGCGHRTKNYSAAVAECTNCGAVL